MGRRDRRRHDTSHLGHRQATSLKGLGFAIVALIALLALGGQLATSAAGCFSTVSADQSGALKVGGQGGDEREESQTQGSFRVDVKPKVEP